MKYIVFENKLGEWVATSDHIDTFQRFPTKADALFHVLLHGELDSVIERDEWKRLGTHLIERKP